MCRRSEYETSTAAGSAYTLSYMLVMRARRSARGSTETDDDGAASDNLDGTMSEQLPGDVDPLGNPESSGQWREDHEFLPVSWLLERRCRLSLLTAEEQRAANATELGWPVVSAITDVTGVVG